MGSSRCITRFFSTRKPEKKPLASQQERSQDVVLFTAKPSMPDTHARVPLENQGHAFSTTKQLHALMTELQKHYTPSEWERREALLKKVLSTLKTFQEAQTKKHQPFYETHPDAPVRHA
ncbi:MAG: hypothetical protein ACKO37_02905 [Vampirovibrionales bacterium]